MLFRSRPKAVAAKEKPEVVVRAVHEKPSFRESREEGADVERLERVHEVGRAVPRELQEAHLLEVVMKRVRLRVERDVDAWALVERGEERAERRGFGDEVDASG